MKREQFDKIEALVPDPDGRRAFVLWGTAQDTETAREIAEWEAVHGKEATVYRVQLSDRLDPA